MKKRYTVPKMVVVPVKSSDIVCTSPETGFGDGDTNVMHAKGQCGFFDDESYDE